VAPPTPPPTPATKRCVYCGEEILAVALKCKHCGEILDPALRAAEEAKRTAALAASRPVHAPAAPQPQIIQQKVIVKTGRKYRVPHLLHLFLTVITFGLWLPIWILHALLNMGGSED
jgi:hypothetical protein